MCRIHQDTIRRLELATEEMFLYCLSTLAKAGLNSPVTTRFNHHARGFQVLMEYSGPKGVLDKYLQPGRIHELKMQSFESMSLCLASKILDHLSAHHWPKDGLTCYIMSLNCQENS
jgi:hypothetical protein